MADVISRIEGRAVAGPPALGDDWVTGVLVTGGVSDVELSAETVDVKTMTMTQYSSVTNKTRFHADSILSKQSMP